MVSTKFSNLELNLCLFFVCFDLGFHTRNPVIKYRPDASCMSYMEARAEMPRENNSQSPISQAQRVADRVHLRLAFLPAWDSNYFTINIIR